MDWSAIQMVLDALEVSPMIVKSVVGVAVVYGWWRWWTQRQRERLVATLEAMRREFGVDVLHYENDEAWRTSETMGLLTYYVRLFGFMYPSPRGTRVEWDRWLRQMLFMTKSGMLPKFRHYLIAVGKNLLFRLIRVLPG